MYRYAQSALSAAGLQLRGRGQPAQQEGARHGDSTRSGAPLSMYENVLRSVALSQKATQEIAHGVVLLSRGVFKQTQLVGGLVMWILALYLNIWVCAIATLLLLSASASWIALGVLAFQLALILLPLGDEPPEWGRRLLAYSIGAAVNYFPFTLRMEDPAAVEVKRPYIVAFEPHSALPVAMPGILCEYSGLLPPGLSGIKTLASSSIFFVPGLRHAWHWLGMRPVSKPVMSAILAEGGSVALCPGGVQECLHMRHGEEAVYLTRRTGFVKMAMQHGAALLPAFAFGQTDMYSWVKPGPPWVPGRVVEALARWIGFLPLVIYGVWGTPMPRRVPVTLVMGAPIVVPHITDPSREQVQEQLQRFITAMEALVAKHKASAGYPDLPLRIY
mmetsp:Transcript_1876/g.5480  ORF Transcript_1876/g.5480 Transcript_1876/m.5480 type:complete len:388 (+) Transcript_1876:286-1449(+)